LQSLNAGVKLKESIKKLEPTISDQTLTLSEQLPPNPEATVSDTLALTAEERTRSRYRFMTTAGVTAYLRLPRGTVLQDGDLLRQVPEDHQREQVVRVMAKPEPVITATTLDMRLLLRAAYHLGNRHVPLEVTPDWLRLAPDPVLETMLRQLGLSVRSELAPFKPEAGAYGHHGHDHG
jgi:urease accessory protein